MPNEHFSKLAYNWCCRRVLRNCWICYKCSSQLLLKMRMSFKYTTTKELVNGCNRLSIIIIKVVGAIVKPKGMTNHSKRPFIDLKAVFHTSIFFYWDLMIARLQINLIEKFSSPQLVKKVVNSGDRVLILDYGFVKGSIVNTNSPCPIFLLHQYNWTPTSWRDWTDMPLLEQFLTLFPNVPLSWWDYLFPYFAMMHLHIQNSVYSIICISTQFWPHIDKQLPMMRRPKYPFLLGCICARNHGILEPNAARSLWYPTWCEECARHWWTPTLLDPFPVVVWSISCIDNHSFWQGNISP